MFVVLFETDVVFDVLFALEMLCNDVFAALFDFPERVGSLLLCSMLCSRTLFCSTLCSDEEVNAVFAVC